MRKNQLFSGKKKATQLKEKRERKRQANMGIKNEDVEELEGVPTELFSSLGKSGNVNRFSTVFAKESNEDIEQRRIDSQIPLDLSKRGQPLVAEPRHDEDPLFNFPRGKILAEGFRGKSVEVTDVDKEMEERDFRDWLENIYRHYRRSELNQFEHNIDVWRQLWHTLHTADVLCLVADCRNPLWHIPSSLYSYITSELRKKLIIVLSKTDLVSPEVVTKWVLYIKATFPFAEIVPFSASGINLPSSLSLSQRRRALKEQKQNRGTDTAAAEVRANNVNSLLSVAGVCEVARALVCNHLKAAVKPKKLNSRESKLHSFKHHEDRFVEDSSDNDSVYKGQEELGGECDSLEEESTISEVAKVGLSTSGEQPVSRSVELDAHNRRPMILGFLGHPNVGKSSTINAIFGKKRVSVSRTAGHTKRAQSIPLTRISDFDSYESLKNCTCVSCLVQKQVGSPSNQCYLNSSEVSTSLVEVLDCPGLVFPESLITYRDVRNRSDQSSCEDGVTAQAGLSNIDQSVHDAFTNLENNCNTKVHPSLIRNYVDMSTRRRAMQECLGVVPLAQVREPYSAVRLIAEYLPLEQMYGLRLDKDEREEGWSPLLITEKLAEKMGLRVARVGRPDAHAAGRHILYECQDGVIPFYFVPPPTSLNTSDLANNQS